MRKMSGKIALLVLIAMLMGLLPLQAGAVSAPVSIGETGFDTLATALQAAVAEDTVVLNDDITESYVTVKPGVTLDLSGHVLTSEYVVGLKGSAVIDSSDDNSGKIVAAQDCVALDQTNGSYFPVYEENGFVFTTVKLAGRSKFVSVAKFLFSPVFESFAHDALASGEAASGARVMVRLSWSNEGDGNYRAQQDFAYLDKLVKSVVGSYNGSNYAKAFAADFGGSEAGLIDSVTALAVLSSVTGVELAGESAIAPTAEDAMKELLENKTKLRFDEDGEFKVVVLADMHTKAGGLDEVQQGYVKTMIDREQPDFVIFTGDNVRSLSGTPIADEAAMREVLDNMVGYLEEKGIYWMHVYGNHDDENNPLDKETQQAIYESYEYCLSKDVEELYGVGNYVIPLYGSDESTDDIKFAFWGLDSGSYMSAEDKAALFPAGATGYNGYSGTGYDYIHHDQIRWYENTSEQLEVYVGAKVPGLMAFHIPLQEYSVAWDNRENLDHSGYKMENVCASAYNSGLFDTMRSRGDIKATVSGHDHKNSFMVEYGGIKLCYSPTMSTNSYYDEAEMGSRVFVLKEEDPADVKTYMSYLTERIDTSDAKPIESGYTYDFEGEAPTFTVSGNNGTATNLETASVCVKDGVGKDGSRALAATRTEWDASGVGKRTLEIKWDIPYGKLGENKYVAVWIDLATDDLEFRKTNFGLITDYDYTAPYRTDESDGVNTPFYYKADGSADWVTLQTGTDGCFGAGDSCPVKGYKGWFAFPIEYMLQYQTDAQLNKDSVITGFYVFTQLWEESMVGKDIIFDNFTLVKDYQSLGLQVLPSGTTYDFEGEAPTLKIGYANYSAEENKHDTIYAQILENKGVDGSKALALCRTAWGTNNTQRNAAVQWNAPSEGLLGDNEYLMVWMDFATNPTEFRKASWGLMCSDSANPYRTDDYGAGAQFYYKADGSDEWNSYTLDSDGCFGVGDTCTATGLKGWFAFPTSTLKQRTNTLKKDSIVTGYYFYFCPNAETDVNQQVYIDNIMLVKDYKTAL